MTGYPVTTPEGRVKAAIKVVLKKLQAWCYMPVQNGMGVTGIPDHIACVPVVITPEMVGRRIGVFAAIEAKAPGKAGNTTANQRRHLAEIQEAGGVALVIDSTDQAVIAEAVQQRIEALMRDL